MKYFNALDTLPGMVKQGDHFTGKFLLTDNVTVSYWEIEAGFIVQEHQHDYEGITTVLYGEVEMTINGETRILTAGMTAFIPSNTPHSGKIITTCKMMDMTYPIAR